MSHPCPRARRARALVIAVLALVTASALSPPPATAVVYAPSPFLGKVLYVDPSSNAARDAAALASTDPSSAAALRKIAANAQADWFGDWNSAATVTAAVNSRVSTITKAGAYPVLVTY